MTLSELSVRRPVLPVVAALLILALGAAALMRLPVREYPDVEPPKVSVSIAYPGASARLVARDVTREVEDNLNGIDGVELIDSRSRAGFSEITVEFVLGRDLDAAAADVRDRVSAVRRDLPERAEAPVIRKSSAQSQAMMWITLTSESRGRRALTDLAVRDLTDAISILPGVSQVVLGGARRYAMRVRLDAGRMAARGVTVADVRRALERENIEAPAGRIETPTREYELRTETRLPDAPAFRELILREGLQGRVRLGDVAEVELGAESDRSAVYRSGEPAVGLGVVRQSGSNVIAVADRVRAELDRLRPRLPEGVDMAVSYDQSVFVERSIGQVARTLLMTAALVVAVVWLSLGSLRGLAGPAATIPAALVGTFAVMSALGFSVNTLTLLALVVAIGLVVDDAIVVLENVTRKREQGQGRMAAAILGAREVFLPVVATTAVLAAVLLPIAALTGLTGRLFTQFAVTLTSAVALSSLLALTLGAMLASRTAEAKTGAEAGNPLTRVFTGALGRAEAGYARLVGALVRAPWLAAALAVGLGAGSWGLAQSLPGALAPTEDRAAFIIPVNAPEGATLSETEAAMRDIAAILEPYAGEDGPIEDVISIAGAGTQGPPRVSEGLIIAKLRPWEEREISQQALVGEVIGPISALPGAQAAPINPASLIPQSFGKPVQVYVAASDHDRAKGWAEEIFAPAVERGGLRAPRIEFDRSNPQIALRLDRRLASDLGLSAAAVGEALRVFFGGDDITEFHRDGETYEVMVRGRPEDRDREAAIGALQVRGAQGRLVPLAAAVETQARGSAPSYRRIDRRPAVVISAVPAQGADFAALLGRFERLAEERLPPEAETGFLGLSREFAESRAGFLGVMGLALAVVYLVLAALFSSFALPLAVMLAAPLAVTGGLAGLWAAGLGLNVFSQIGLLLAVGLMAKNAILVVDFANRRRAEGLELAEAARAGARARFRPVVMTSVATLFGAVPLALATGAGAESRTVIGVAVLAGVTGATLITLFLVPALYRLFGALSRPPGAASAEADRQLAEADG